MPKLEQLSQFRFHSPMVTRNRPSSPDNMATNSSSSSSMCSPKSPSSPTSSSNYMSDQSTSDIDISSPQINNTKFAGLPRLNLTDLKHFPSQLADPARLLLVSCTDPSKAHLYSCRDCKVNNTIWALNFHHRHAFCTGCGQSAADAMPAKLFAELFMAATTAYISEPQELHLSPNSRNTNNSSRGWWVGADSSCVLRFMSATGADACGCSSGNHYDEEAEEAAACSGSSVWAVNSVYSHAFCTRCGRSADGASLLSLLMIIRFGGKKLLSRRSSSNLGGCPKSCSGLSPYKGRNNCTR